MLAALCIAHTLASRPTARNPAAGLLRQLIGLWFTGCRLMIEWFGLRPRLSLSQPAPHEARFNPSLPSASPTLGVVVGPMGHASGRRTDLSLRPLPCAAANQTVQRLRNWIGKIGIWHERQNSVRTDHSECSMDNDPVTSTFETTGGDGYHRVCRGKVALRRDHPQKLRRQFLRQANP